MIKVERITSEKGEKSAVYDISLDGTVVNALGMNIMHNTDGFNFRFPDNLRYTDDNPYVSTGGGRHSVKGRRYTGVEADVAEFEDVYMHSAFNGGINKMGLDVDEYVESSINCSRKNYCDLLDNGKMKLVGNSIKSKKMPIYIEKFLDAALSLLLHGKGKEFLDLYYDYIEKIYNFRIPLKDIATVGKIKISIGEYKKKCQELTAAGTKRARQAWYELAIRDNLPVHMGDAVYYINTGTKKGDSDVQRVTNYFRIGRDGVRTTDALDENGDILRDRRGVPVSMTKDIDRRYAKWRKMCRDKGEEPSMNKREFALRLYPDLQEEDVMNFNCVMLPNNIVEDEEDHFCDSTFEYNVAKYIEMFNKRITPLLVCFRKEVRERVDEKGRTVTNILISNPADRKYFTDQECRLSSGEPFREKDQDTYEALMTIEDKEMRFWLSVGKTPPYVRECGIDWEAAVASYRARVSELEKDENRKTLDRYQAALTRLTQEDVDRFAEEGTLPPAIAGLVQEGDDGMSLVSRSGVAIGSIYDILDYDFGSAMDEDGDDAETEE